MLINIYKRTFSVAVQIQTMDFMESGFVLPNVLITKNEHSFLNLQIRLQKKKKKKKEKRKKERKKKETEFENNVKRKKIIKKINISNLKMFCTGEQSFHY